ncbi:hypothetical protein J5N97_029320 [Dioscorea zingiberensis]|uniref:Cytochrome P450 n=1 Tax=Dioscorea zingiberensis TaxID=325984 RepID=A0A9D5C1D7_9LILI|nr:hypothetical protein J5N97_029320 [Dioscorea zingiberensis]
MEFTWLLLLVLFITTTIFLLLHLNPTPTPNFTPLKPYPILQNLPHLVKNSHRLLFFVTELVSSSPSSTSTLIPFVFTSNPSNVEHMLRSNFPNYIKGSSVISTLHDFLGDGIFNSNGPLWRLQRKTASFEFNTKSLRSFIFHHVRHESLHALLPILSNTSRASLPVLIDLQDLLERFAFDNVCSLVFGHDPRCLHDSADGLRFFHAFQEASHLSIERMNHAFDLLWKVNKWLNVGSERRLNHSLLIVREYASRFVSLRKTQAGDDLLSRFAADETISDDLLVDILICFVLAGRDTTPAALSWFFWLLSSRPDVSRNILVEIQSIRARSGDRDGDRFFSLEELREMNYLHAALSEAMRLYPPVPLLPRCAAEDDVLPDGTVVKKGWTLMYNAYAMGRMESIWGKDCMEMRPERWLEDGVFQPTSPFRYPVFLGGPRMCLGKEMAYIQMKAVAACILEKFDIDVVGASGEPQLSVTMTMKGGLPVRIKERNPCTKAV